MTQDKLTPAGPEILPNLVTHDETRLLDGRVVCLQPKSGYRIAIDPVFLAAAIAAKPGDRVLDAGSGTGAASLCLAARVSDVKITGIEIQPEYAALARQSAHLNGRSQQPTFVDGDLAALPTTSDFREFDHVMTNPPYIENSRGRVPPDSGKARANIESHLNLKEWLSICIRATRSRGTVTIIHRADRLDHILAAMADKLGHIVVFPLWPGDPVGEDEKATRASRVLVSGRKGVNSLGELNKGMTLHRNPTGAYTKQANSILKDAKALNLFD